MVDQELTGDWFNRIVVVNSMKTCSEMFLDQQIIEKV